MAKLVLRNIWGFPRTFEKLMTKLGKTGQVQAGHLSLIWKMMFLVALVRIVETNFHWVVGRRSGRFWRSWSRLNLWQRRSGATVLTQPIAKPVVWVQEEAWVEGSPEGKRSTQPSSAWNNLSQSTLSRKSSQSGNGHFVTLFHFYLRHKRSGVFEIWLCLAHQPSSHDLSETHESLASWYVLANASEHVLVQVLVRICDVMLKLRSDVMLYKTSE